jgi:hypothetical protein
MSSLIRLGGVLCCELGIRAEANVLPYPIVLTSKFSPEELGLNEVMGVRMLRTNIV